MSNEWAESDLPAMRCNLAGKTSGSALASFVAIVHIPGSRAEDSLAEAVRRGLEGTPKCLPCRFFYDDEGSRLFEEICELPEYYLTRTEDAILREHARAMMAGRRGAPMLVELGSGSSTKTRRLIAAGMAEYGALHYAPIDVSAGVLEESAGRLAREFPGLRVTAYAGDYRDALGRLRASSRTSKVLAFLGSSLGNYGTAEAVQLLSEIGRVMGPDDRLLLGTDLVKGAAELEAAYDDARGVTARFNLNLLARINRELGADFDLGGFRHRARYRAEAGRVEMHLVSVREQVVRIPGAGMAVRFAEGEAIHTENSHKYEVAQLREMARRAGCEEEAAWGDDRGRFRVQLWRRAAD